MICKTLIMVTLFGVISIIQGGDHIHFKQGVKTKGGEASKGFITFWSQNPGGEIKQIKDDSGNEIVKLRSDSPNGYLTPMIHLKPIKTTNKTVLSFQLKCPVTGVYSINLTNDTEKAWYSLRFKAQANKWVTVHQYISKASFKRKLEKGAEIINDGMLEDNLIRVQIEAKGGNVLLKNFMIFESEEPTDNF